MAGYHVGCKGLDHQYIKHKKPANNAKVEKIVNEQQKSVDADKEAKIVEKPDIIEADNIKK